MDIRTEMNEKLKITSTFTSIRKLSSLKALTKRSLIIYTIKIQL